MSANLPSDKSDLQVGDRVRRKGHPEHKGIIERVSPEGIHYRVRFDEGCAPNWSQVIDNGCYFYNHELERHD